MTSQSLVIGILGICLVRWNERHQSLSHLKTEKCPVNIYLKDGSFKALSLEVLS